ncbi:peptide chain release factor 2 [Desulfofundulus thermocisternus]|uniref:peptide chain release factor 2 n=1 Tax=Desulfofundulus thermocisternus TaxID=42471 RepID=UPI00217E019E|nr:peptide chain release factor 2 [Desulfofundulus thermocisternus]MCS5695366.1 peptide chain release factor 2 [Desulfofundulus thermocisternus]
MYAELSRELENLGKRIEELRVSLDIAQKEEEIKRLEETMLDPGFWNDPEQAQQVTQKLAALKDRVTRFQELARVHEDLVVLLALGEEEEDEQVAREAAGELKKLARRVEKMELEVLLNGPYDRGNAIVSLHAGAGGTEAQDWVEMLLRMYTRWAEEKGYRVAIMDMLPGDEAGIKSVTFSVTGPNAYGYLRAEKGVHRLVRISPFDAAGRRHTSFASVDVLPEVEEDVNLEIKPEDLKIDTFRSSGAGGQHVNKTESAVRITHLPTGIVVQCQSERSQIANRNAAMKLLRAKLLDLEMKKKEAELAALRGEQTEIAWGNQIRSYVFHPYSLVKDHRTGVEVGNVQAVMDGEIDGFISAYLRQKAKS